VAEEVQDRLARENRIITSSRGGGIRVSLHAYNCADDVRALAQALEAVGRDGADQTATSRARSGPRQARSRPGAQ